MTLMSRLKTVCLMTVFVLSCGVMNSAQAAKEIKPESYQIDAIQWQEEGGGWLCRIKGDVKPAYTMYELFSPHRVIVDIAYGLLGENVELPLELDKGPVTLIKGDILSNQDPRVARIELYLAADHAYSVNSNGNDILVKFESGSQSVAAVPVDKGEAVISDITISGTADETKIFLKAGGPVKNYQTTELAKEKDHPARLIVDISGIPTTGHAVPASDNSPVILVRTENYKGGTRVILDSASKEIFQYELTGKGDGLLIAVTAPSSDAAKVVAGITGLPEAEIVKKKPAEIRPVAVAKQAVKKEKPSTASVSETDRSKATSDFTFAGYNEQKISVDFYKIDLHNVFRLIGEISGRNIVVDEGVAGSLTLTLNDVPWDFVLDVILNLKDLAKEERFNTIVISEKSEKFVWPEHAGTQLEMEVDEDVLKVESRQTEPIETRKAKQFIRQAQDQEQAGNYEQSVGFYEKALVLVPDSSKVAERIASLCLSRLGQNAKAAHFAQKAFKLDPNNTKAALIAAVSLANLEKIQEAKGYFDVAVGVDTPTKQALISYAAFSEQNKSFNSAVKLLKKYEQIYGSSMQVMVSKARIYDKLGKKALADAEYRSALHSGDTMPENLKLYIQNRLEE